MVKWFIGKLSVGIAHRHIIGPHLADCWRHIHPRLSQMFNNIYVNLLPTLTQHTTKMKSTSCQHAARIHPACGQCHMCQHCSHLVAVLFTFAASYISLQQLFTDSMVPTKTWYSFINGKHELLVLAFAEQHKLKCTRRHRWQQHKCKCHVLPADR